MSIKYTAEEKQKYFDGLPKKHMATGAIMFDRKNRLLIVKPTYKDGWTIPGGVVDADESPRTACIREVKEEVSLDITDPTLLCVDYVTAGSYEYLGENLRKPEVFQFVFDGGILSDGQISDIRIQEEELSEYRFVTIDEALKLLRANLTLRIPKCLEAIESGRVCYLENGEKV